MEARTANRESPVPFDARGGGGAEAFFVIAATASGGSINKATVLPSWALWFWQGVLGLIAITSGGLTATFRSVFEIARQTTKNDDPTIVRARPKQSVRVQITTGRGSNGELPFNDLFRLGRL